MLDTLKVMLGIAAEETSLDAKLEWIISSTKARLKTLLGGIEPPESLEYIIVEVAIIRFNKIGSEGLASHSVEGESLQYNDNDFAPYLDEIQAYLEQQKDSSRGRVKFL